MSGQRSPSQPLPFPLPPWDREQRRTERLRHYIIEHRALSLELWTIFLLFTSSGQLGDRRLWNVLALLQWYACTFHHAVHAWHSCSQCLLHFFHFSLGDSRHDTLVLNWFAEVEICQFSTNPDSIVIMHCMMGNLDQNRSENLCDFRLSFLAHRKYWQSSAIIFVKIALLHEDYSNDLSSIMVLPT